jgi:glycosyltransferase involved in cell wall biosynthesis
MTISAIICCYNGELYLRDTLRSLLEQTRPPDEIIVVDEGSKDKSAAIAESFGAPVRVIRQANKGLPASRNVGLAAATSTDLFFIDADDLIAPTSLEMLAAAKGNDPDVVALMGFAPFTDDPHTPQSERLFDFTEFFPHILEGNFGPQHNRLVSKALATRAGGFDPSMYIFEDWLFWCRVALHGGRIAPIHFVGAHYRRHAQTMSDTAPSHAYISGHVRVMEELSEGMLARTELLERFGDRLFWECWVALTRARERQVPWSQLATLERSINAVARHPRVGSRVPRLMKMVKYLGIRTTERLRRTAGALSRRPPSR